MTFKLCAPTVQLSLRPRQQNAVAAQLDVYVGAEFNQLQVAGGSPTESNTPHCPFKITCSICFSLATSGLSNLLPLGQYGDLPFQGSPKHAGAYTLVEGILAGMFARFSCRTHFLALSLQRRWINRTLET